MSDKKSAACVLIINDENQILCVSRKDNPNDFGLPGGKAEDFETLANAAMRETLEETGYTVLIDPWNPFIDMCGEYLVVTYKATIDTKIERKQMKEKGIVGFKDPSVLLQGSFKEYNEELLKAFGII
jgi:8-oxo-dGTP pyrophosphatase MutT (NUDIX family)